MATIVTKINLIKVLSKTPVLTFKKTHILSINVQSFKKFSTTFMDTCSFHPKSLKQNSNTVASTKTLLRNPFTMTNKRSFIRENKDTYLMGKRTYSIRATNKQYYINEKQSLLFRKMKLIRENQKPYSIKSLNPKPDILDIKKYSLQEKVSTFQIKKRPNRKRKNIEQISGQFTAVAFATADEYSLENLIEGLRQQDLYVPNVVDNLDDVVLATAKYRVDNEPREIFFFREGSVVLWNVTELESSNILQFVKQYEQNSYNDKLIQSESEHMTYTYAQEGKSTHLNPHGKIMLSVDEHAEYDKYAVSNAMGLSVKLGLWEAQLENYIDSIEYVTEDLKLGHKIKLTQEDVLRKHGELFALRHMINLSSDLLDIPDFYWDRENLENIYCQTCGYFSISRRTKVMNEKLNHCVELIELLSTHLSDKHHVRLEWMIIVLIMVEVAFETLHYIERYYS